MPTGPMADIRTSMSLYALCVHGKVVQTVTCRDMREYIRRTCPEREGVEDRPDDSSESNFDGKADDVENDGTLMNAFGCEPFDTTPAEELNVPDRKAALINIKGPDGNRERLKRKLEARVALDIGRKSATVQAQAGSDRPLPTAGASATPDDDIQLMKPPHLSKHAAAAGNDKRRLHDSPSALVISPHHDELALAPPVSLEFCVTVTPAGGDQMYGALDSYTETLSTSDIDSLKSTVMVTGTTTTFLMCMACIGVAESTQLPLTRSSGSVSHSTPPTLPMYKLPKSGAAVSLISTIHSALIIKEMAEAKAQDRADPQPTFLLNANRGPRARGLWSRCPVLCDCYIVACVVQPMPAEYPLQQHTRGNHFMLVLFINFPAINWHATDAESARGPASVFVMDSLPAATTAAEFEVVREAFQAFIVQEAMCKYDVARSKAAEIVSSIIWRKVKVPEQALSGAHGVMVCGVLAPHNLRRFLLGVEKHTPSYNPTSVLDVIPWIDSHMAMELPHVVMEALRATAMRYMLESILRWGTGLSLSKVDDMLQESHPHWMHTKGMICPAEVEWAGHWPGRHDGV